MKFRLDTMLHWEAGLASAIREWVAHQKCERRHPGKSAAAPNRTLC